MNTLHRISPAEILAALDSEAHEDKENIIFNLAVTGNWGGHGRIDFSAPSGSSTGPFREINSFSFVATSSFGTAAFAAVDLAFAYWTVGSSGLMNSFSILTNPVDGFSLSIQFGQDAAKLEGKKFRTLEAGTLTHSATQPSPKNQYEILERQWTGGPVLRQVK
ncbi:MAG: hypothetical protein O3C49_09880 [Proteobacteria bacterium]|nr:hypothetical protein [Pseudomonadota bacterium]MDA1323955.1 hypothetical protein [Pseudomonadota bacterium]